MIESLEENNLKDKENVKRIGNKRISTSLLAAWTTTGNVVHHDLGLGTTVLDQTRSPFHQRVAFVVGQVVFQHFFIAFLIRCL